MRPICRRRPDSLRGVMTLTLGLCLAGLLSSTLRIVNANECAGDHDPTIIPTPIEVDKDKLAQVPVAGLESETPLHPQIDPRCLPTSSEGLLIQSSHAIVSIDGEENKDNKKACMKPGRQYRLPLAP
jgi:hypothetical protein